jgi:hypothetical protein
MDKDQYCITIFYIIIIIICIKYYKTNKKIENFSVTNIDVDDINKLATECKIMNKAINGTGTTKMSNKHYNIKGTFVAHKSTVLSNFKGCYIQEKTGANNWVSLNKNGISSYGPKALMFNINSGSKNPKNKILHSPKILSKNGIGAVVFHGDDGNKMDPGLFLPEGDFFLTNIQNNAEYIYIYPNYDVLVCDGYCRSSPGTQQWFKPGLHHMGQNEDNASYVKVRRNWAKKNHSNFSEMVM